MIIFKISTSSKLIDLSFQQNHLFENPVLFCIYVLHMFCINLRMDISFQKKNHGTHAGGCVHLTPWARSWFLNELLDQLSNKLLDDLLDELLDDNLDKQLDEHWHEYLDERKRLITIWTTRWYIRWKIRLIIQWAIKWTRWTRLLTLVEIRINVEVVVFVTTPTQRQPNLNCSWRLDTKMTVHTTPPPPHKLNVCNISAVIDPILTKL